MNTDEPYSLLDQLQDGILIIDFKTRQVLFHNKSVSELTGIPTSDFIFEHFLEWIPSEIQPELENFFSFVSLQVSSPNSLIRIIDQSPPIELTIHTTTYHGQEALALTLHNISNQRKAEESAQRRAIEFAALYAMTKSLASQNDLASLLNEVVEHASILLRTYGGQISLYDPEKETLELKVNQAFIGNPIEIIEIGHDVTELVAQKMKPVMIDDYEKWSQKINVPADKQVKSILGVPMIYAGSLVGVLCVFETQQRRSFTEAEVRLLSLLASQAAGAVHNARLLEETRSRLSEIEAVNRVSAILRISTDLSNMLAPLMRETLSTLNAEAGVIVILDLLKKKRITSFGLGWCKAIADDPSFDSINPFRSLIEERKSLHCKNISDKFQETLFSIPNNVAGLCVPILISQSMGGYFCLASFPQKNFSITDLRLLQTLADICGEAFQRAYLFEETEKRFKRISALHTIDIAISASSDIRFTLNVFLEQLSSLLILDGAVVYGYHPNGNKLEKLAQIGLTKPKEENTLFLKKGDPLELLTIEKKPLYLNDLNIASYQSDHLHYLVEKGITSYFAIPLISKGIVEGILEIYYCIANDLNDETIGIVESLASQAAIALENAHLFSGLQRSNRDLTLAYDATIEGWVLALDLRDRETEGHSQRVAGITVRLAHLAGVSEDHLIHIYRGALLHDIGKMAIPDNILLKPGKLDDDEWNIMKTHPQRAFEMLSPIHFLLKAIDIPYCHHERWDGNGYPRGLRAKEIPLAARIFSVIDVWDALASNRPYRLAWDRDKILAYLSEQAGKQFDPLAVNLFTKMIEEDSW